MLPFSSEKSLNTCFKWSWRFLFQSQHHRIAEVGRYVWGLSSLIPPDKVGSPTADCSGLGPPTILLICFPLLWIRLPAEALSSEMPPACTASCTWSHQPHGQYWVSCTPCPTIFAFSSKTPPYVGGACIYLPRGSHSNALLSYLFPNVLLNVTSQSVQCHWGCPSWGISKDPLPANFSAEG